MTTRWMWTAGVALALAMPAEAKDQTGAIIALGVLGVACLLAPAIFLYLAARVRAKAEQAQNWASTEGVVTAVSISTHRTKGSYWYVPHVAYRFQVGRQDYSGKRLRFGWLSLKSEAEAAAVIAGYRVDGPITVRYDSNKPSDNVIKPEATTKAYTIGAWAFIALDVVFAIVVATVLLGKK